MMTIKKRASLEKGFNDGVMALLTRPRLAVLMKEPSAVGMTTIVKSDTIMPPLSMSTVLPANTRTMRGW